ncbi:hypothetical protein BJI49_12595 [Acetobacter pasteurianus]|uniref:hypothetical protein n=1 Tax=Acetobacter pasteurianus TaxID=438 RepID=UPI00024580F7|nr:hypothetical protein [Acetobacter pasteurianus]RCL04674.1 hypothetical protein BJI49_12595 [Acetobacter pasteurianus]GAB31512.1 hypothetical protein APS_2114 [Acetobacter pasteurianus subsp. pasteurianus LMG 1262 = NBRC 106471]
MFNHQALTRKQAVALSILAAQPDGYLTHSKTVASASAQLAARKLVRRIRIDGFWYCALTETARQEYPIIRREVRKCLAA